MKTKTLLSIAIIAALPFTANATQTIVETNTPAAVGANGTVKKAADSGPYQTATIGEHDDEHIATTAYVKGAYNDTIAAVNKVDEWVKELDHYINSDMDDMIEGKQDKFSIVESDDEINTEILDGITFDNYIRSGFTDDGGYDMSTHLVTAEGVANGITAYIHSDNGARVRVYTTWGNDSASVGANIESARDFQ